MFGPETAVIVVFGVIGLVWLVGGVKTAYDMLANNRRVLRLARMERPVYHERGSVSPRGYYLNRHIAILSLIWFTQTSS